MMQLVTAAQTKPETTNKGSDVATLLQGLKLGMSMVGGSGGGDDDDDGPADPYGIAGAIKGLVSGIGTSGKASDPGGDDAGVKLTGATGETVAAFAAEAAAVGVDADAALAASVRSMRAKLAAAKQKKQIAAKQNVARAAGAAKKKKAAAKTAAKKARPPAKRRRAKPPATKTG